MGNQYSCDATSCQAATDQSPTGMCTVTSAGTPLTLELHKNTCTLLGGSFGTPPEPCNTDYSKTCFDAVKTHGVGGFGKFSVFNQGVTTLPGVPPPGEYSIYKCTGGECSRSVPATIPGSSKLITDCLGAGVPPDNREITTVECPGCQVGADSSNACTAEVQKFTSALPYQAFVVYNNNNDDVDVNSGMPAKGQFIIGECLGSDSLAVCTVSKKGKITGDGPVGCVINDTSKGVLLGKCKISLP
jgi:hypothetical protein